MAGLVVSVVLGWVAVHQRAGEHRVRLTTDLVFNSEQGLARVEIDDIVEAIRRAGTFSGVGGEIFQIATNSETSVLALASLLSNVLSRKGINVQPPAHLPSRRGEVQSNYSDTSKARTRLGWEATTDLTDGLRKTVEWFTTRERRFS